MPHRTFPLTSPPMEGDDVAYSHGRSWHSMADARPGDLARLLTVFDPGFPACGVARPLYHGR